MKRFQFPLDRVLRYRQLQAEAEEAKLQGELARLAQADSHLAQLDREGLHTQEAVRQSLAPDREVLPGQMANYPNYRNLLARSRQGLEAERQKRLQQVERQRAAVLVAHRAREVLIRARAAAHEKWQAEYIKEMDATAAELFLSQWTPRRRR